VFNLAVADLVTSSGGEAIKMIPHHIVYKNGPSHSYYTVEWDTAGPSSPANTLETIGGLLFAGGDRYKGVTTYTSYQVTVTLGDKRRVYNALALHWAASGPLSKPPSEIMDQVTPGMDEVLADESPRARSPWDTYVKSPLYREVVRLVSKTIASHLPLIPGGAPIGYLPGDRLPGYEGGGFSPQASNCQSTSVTIGPLTAVGEGQSATVQIALSPSPSQSPITLSISPTTGSGAATFSSTGTATMTVSQTVVVTIKGITHSSASNNMQLTASGGGASTVSTSFTVISVVLSLRNGNNQTVSRDDSGAKAYKELLGGTSLGTFHSSGTNTSLWRTGVEIVGTVLPNDYNGLITIQRELDAQSAYNGSTLTSTSSLCGPPPCTDTSNLPMRDDDPQSGGSGGKVYDLDAPGIATAPTTAVGTILRVRVNFHEWATIKASNNGVSTDLRVSADLGWFHRVSIIKTSSGDILQTDIFGDNTSGLGTTALTWNLQ
ncbi:MAG TPA: hypothetical protein VJX67_15170, partial [Blastocatellia bacterium]|nr:hypothetical protein [Blastocatellia bacterium]